MRKKQPKERSKRAFGPLTPSSERPLVLPGGRRWYRPKDAYNDEFIAETLSAQAELITGSTLGWVESLLPAPSPTWQADLCLPSPSPLLPPSRGMPLSIAIDIAKAILCAILPWSQSPSPSPSHSHSHSHISCSFLIFHGTLTTTTTATMTATTTTTTATATRIASPRSVCDLLHNFAH